MRKELKDYIFLYLDCEFLYGGYGDPEQIVEVTGVSLVDGIQFIFKDDGRIDTDTCVEYFTPILRPLSDITEEEERNYYAIKGENSSNVFEGESTLYLISKHFDVFGLIEAGLAIDKTTLNFLK